MYLSLLSPVGHTPSTQGIWEYSRHNAVECIKFSDTRLFSLLSARHKQHDGLVRVLDANNFSKVSFFVISCSKSSSKLTFEHCSQRDTRNMTASPEFSLGSVIVAHHELMVVLAQAKARRFKAQVCVGCQKIVCILLHGIVQKFSHPMYTLNAAAQGADVCRVSESRVYSTAWNPTIHSHTICTLSTQRAQNAGARVSKSCVYSTAWHHMYILAPYTAAA